MKSLSHLKNTEIPYSCPLIQAFRNPEMFLKRCKIPKIFFFINLFFIYLFFAALGLRCYAWAFSSCGEQGLLFVAVHGLLIAVASLVLEHGL